MRPAPIYDLTNVVADTVALDIIYEGFLFLVLSGDDNKKVASNINVLYARLACKNHTQFMTKLANIDSLFMTKTAEQPYPLGPHVHVPKWPIQRSAPGRLKTTEIFTRRPYV